MATAVAGAPGIQPNTPQTAMQTGGTAPFRIATRRKTVLNAQTQATVTAAVQPVEVVLEGTGYLTSVDLDLQCVTAGNGAGVAYNADAPWNAFSSIVFKDTNSDLVNLTGYGLFLLNVYGGQGTINPAGSTDALVYAAVTGAGATGGSFRVALKLPLSINERSLIGLLGNQDRAVKYQLRTDFAASATIYSVAPTNAGALTLNRHLNTATVPLGQNVEPMPKHYGVIRTITQLTSEAAPASGATLTHFVRSIGNTIRVLILVFRDSTGARADAVLPNRLTLRVGEDTLYVESAAERRQKMFLRYGFDAPAGVLVYDFISDFGNRAGYELGYDYLNTRNVPNVTIECTYPVFGNTPGTLQFITDSLNIPMGMDILPLM